MEDNPWRVGVTYSAYFMKNFSFVFLHFYINFAACLDPPLHFFKNKVKLLQV